MQTDILSFCETPQVDLVQDLLDHRLTNTITQDQKTFCFHVPEKNGKETWCGGLMKRLQKNFYSERQTAGKIVRKRGTSGVQTGIRVHRQIHHLVQCKRTGKCDCTVKTSEKRLHKYTKSLFSKLKAMGIEPVATEVPVYCKPGRFCTRLDMIGYQGISKIPTIISLKTGYNVGFNRDARDTTFEEPFDEIPSTSQNINQLQALSEHEILKREYKLDFPNYFIIYMGKKKRKTKKQIEEEEVLVDNPSKWWWRSNEETLDQFYSKLSTK